MQLIITEKHSNIPLQTFVSDDSNHETININSGDGLSPKQVFCIDHLIYDKDSVYNLVEEPCENNKFLLGVTVGVGTVLALALTVKICKIYKKKG